MTTIATIVPAPVERALLERPNGFTNMRNLRRPLTEDEMKQYASSLFAKHKHDSRSEKYTYIPTIDIIRSLRKEGWEVYAVSQGGARAKERRGFTKHLVRMRRPNEEVKAIGDTVGELILRNAHDGTSSYKMQCGWFRLVCLNGMISSDKEHPEFSIKFPHRGDIIREVTDSSYKIIGQMKIAADQIKAMKGLQLNLKDQRWLANEAIKLRHEDHVIAVLTADSVLTARRKEDTGNDLWNTFNRIQENITKGGQRYYTFEGNEQRRNTTRALTGVVADTKVNSGLWSLAADLLHKRSAN